MPKLKDRYHDEMKGIKNTYTPSKAEKHAIRVHLKMESHANFARCRYRNYPKACKLDLADGFTSEEIGAGLGFHTKKEHVCALCRCTNTAGQHTHGWWHWSRENTKGFKEVGHYGVGPCWEHVPSGQRGNHSFQAKYRETIMNEIDSCREAGLAPDPHGGFMVALAENADNALIRNDIRQSLESTKTIMDEMVVKLKQEDFTETVSGQLVQASDVTIHKLKLQTLKAIASIAKTDFDVSKGEYAHRDMITVMIRKFLIVVDMIYKPKGTSEDWAKLGCAMKDILTSMSSADGGTLFKQKVL